MEYSLLLKTDIRGYFPLIIITFVYKHIRVIPMTGEKCVSSDLIDKISSTQLCDSLTEEGRVLLALGIGFYFRMSCLSEYR